MKQVHTTPPEQVPEQIPDQLSVEEVLSPAKSGTQANDTHVADPVREPIASQQGANGCASDDNQPCEQVPNNVTPITRARKHRAGVEDPSRVRGGQSSQIDPKRKIDPLEAQIEGAGGSGAELATSGAKQVRKQGQRGKDKQPRKIRYDNNQFMIPADDRQRIVKHNLDLYRLGTLKDRNDLDEVLERIESYFNICAMNAVMPTVAGFALALGVDRNTLWDWMDGKRGTIKNPDVVGVLKRIYSMINTQYEELLTEGKMIPVGAFFLLQNNHGYKNQTDHVVVAAGDPEPDTADIAARAGLLEEGER